MSKRNDQVPEIYKEAIKKYEEITKKKLDDPALLKLTCVDDLINEIEQRDDKFSEFREKNHSFFTVLEGVMRPIEHIGPVAAGAASMAFSPSSLVFGAVSHLINAANGVSASYNAIQDLMESLKNFTVRLRIYNKEQISEELSDQLSKILVTLIEIFALSRKTIKGGRFQKFARNIIIGSDDKIQEAVSKLEKLTDIEDRLVSAETLTEARKTGRVVDGISVTLDTTHITVSKTGAAVGKMSVEMTELKQRLNNLTTKIEDSSRGGQDDEDLYALKNVLQPSVTAQDSFDKINRSRVAGTGDWIRGEDTFKSWYGRNIPILWVSGNPGAGKSYLSSYIISFLTGERPQGVQHPSLISVAYFFFKDDNPKTRSFHQALRDCAYQISQNDPVYAKYIMANCMSPMDINTLASAWRTLFVNFFVKKTNIASSVYLVIDGVDEADDAGRQEFFDLARDIINTVGARIQLAMIGRPELSDPISDALEIETPTIHVTEHKNSRDIIRYIETSISKSRILRRVSKKLRSEIVTKLSTGAQGMFIWVDFMLKALMANRGESNMRKCLEEAPKGLHEMLRHVLRSFSSSLVEEEATILNELLAWVTCAQRPLKLGELDSLLKVKSSDGDGVIYLEGSLRRQFASFFTLNRDDGLTTAELHLLSGDGDDSDDEIQHDNEDEGVEDVTAFNSNPSETEVTFCHASIGDFFRDESEGNVSAGNGYPSVGVNLKDAKFHVLKTCFELFCDGELRKRSDGGAGASLYVYAKENWLYHFRELDPSELNDQQRKQIGSLLAKMLGDKTAMKDWVALQHRFFTLDNLERIRKWLSDPESRNFLPYENQELAKPTSELPATIFKPLARFVAAQWLGDVHWIPLLCCFQIYVYLCLERGSPPNMFKHSCTTAAEIIDIAEWANLEKDALWYRRVAMALRTRKLYDEAIEFFNKALELDGSMTMARGGTSLCYVLKGEYEVAIELDKITEKEYQQGLIDEPVKLAWTKSLLHTTQEQMAKCYKKLGDQENSLRCYKVAHSTDPGCQKCTDNIIMKSHHKGLHGDIISLLKAMKELKPPDGKYSYLTKSLWDNRYEFRPYHAALQDTIDKTKELDFVLEAYRDAIRAARNESFIVTASLLELCLARLYYQSAHNQKKAVRIWERIFGMFVRPKQATDPGPVHAKECAALQLARHSLRQALHAGIGSPDAEKYIERLETLAKVRVQSEDGSSTFISTGESATMLGLWYRLVGKEEESKACFRPPIKEAIEILSDNDPDNDMEGYAKLAEVFIAAGEFDSAIAIYQILCRSPYAGKQGSEDEEVFSCDGTCGKWHLTYNIYICKYCLDVGFCEDCLKLMKGGSMRWNVCSSQHDWLFVPPPPPQPLEKNTLFINGAVVTLEDFKKDLKQRWQV